LKSRDIREENKTVCSSDTDLKIKLDLLFGRKQLHLAKTVPNSVFSLHQPCYQLRFSGQPIACGAYYRLIGTRQKDLLAGTESTNSPCSEKLLSSLCLLIISGQGWQVQKW